MQALQILKTHGLARCADELCEKLSLKTMQDLANLTDEQIDALTFLREHQPIKLKALCQACREGDPDDLQQVLTRRHLGISYHQRIETLLAKLISE
jgi:ribosomal protein S13